jgi:hypothetical protein
MNAPLPFRIGVRAKFKATGKRVSAAPEPPPSRAGFEMSRLNTPVDPGDRIELVTCTDPYDPVPRGTRGTVTGIYPRREPGKKIWPTEVVYVNWDNGQSLGLALDAGDEYREVEMKELKTFVHDIDAGVDLIVREAGKKPPEQAPDCGASRHGWVCTLQVGHPGTVHEAWAGPERCAIWDDRDSGLAWESGQDA